VRELIKCSADILTDFTSGQTRDLSSIYSSLSRRSLQPTVDRPMILGIEMGQSNRFKDTSVLIDCDYGAHTAKAVCLPWGRSIT